MAAVVILALVTLQRLGELVLARANTAQLLARGGHEVGAGHYPLIVGLHAAWLIGLWLLAPGREVVWGWIAAFVVLQLLRVWVIATLGRRWTTRCRRATSASSWTRASRWWRCWRPPKPCPR